MQALREEQHPGRRPQPVERHEEHHDERGVVAEQVAPHERDVRRLEPRQQPDALVVQAEVVRRRAEAVVVVERDPREVPDVGDDGGGEQPPATRRERPDERRAAGDDHDVVSATGSRSVGTWLVRRPVRVDRLVGLARLRSHGRSLADPGDRCGHRPSAAAPRPRRLACAGCSSGCSWPLNTASSSAEPVLAELDEARRALAAERRRPRGHPARRAPRPRAPWSLRRAAGPAARAARVDGTNFATALLDGFRRALDEGADAIVSLDADGQHDARQIPDLVRSHHAHGSGLTIGSRWTRGGASPGTGAPAHAAQPHRQLGRQGRHRAPAA